MILRIDPSSSAPIYAQIVDQVKRAIASGALRADDPLPSLRETALKLRVNPLTVSKAYKQLEQEGFVETRHGLGSFVAYDPKLSADGFREEMLARSVDSLLIDAVHMGVSFDELKALVDERIQAVGDGFATDQEDGGHRSE